MFPIADRSGRPIAFGGRALAKDVAAKYLNSPETPLFHKGAVLYNHHLARKAAHASGRVIVVEGYIDVIAMASAGFAETVAPLGTALTPDQAALLWKMAEEPILLLRRRQGRAQGGLSRDRHGLAFDRTRTIAALRAAAGGSGSGRSRPRPAARAP